MKILAIKLWFLFNTTKILQGSHIVVGGPKNVYVTFLLIMVFKKFLYRVYCCCAHIWFIENSKCQEFLFLKKEPPKNKFLFFKGPLFCNGWPYWYECWCVLRDFCGFPKKCSFAISHKIWPKLCQFECQTTALKK